MLINQDTAVSTHKLLLVPYRRHHVPQYHEWMQDPAIREATASELLTVEQEYAMQESWRKDADKLTFIVCQPPPQGSPERQHQQQEVQQHPSAIQAGIHDNEEQMIGDVNLFLSIAPSDDDDNIKSVQQQQPPPKVVVTGEVELMIPNPAFRRRGYGHAALTTFLRYILHHEQEILSEFLSSSHAAGSANNTTTTTTATSLPTQSDIKPATKLHLTAKISKDNLASLGLFRKAGFSFTPSKTSSDEQQQVQPNYFGEFELHFSARESMGFGIVRSRAVGASAAAAAAGQGRVPGGYEEEREQGQGQEQEQERDEDVVKEEEEGTWTEVEYKG